MIKITNKQIVSNYKNVARGTGKVSEFAPKPITFEPGSMNLPSLSEIVEKKPVIQKIFNYVKAFASTLPL